MSSNPILFHVSLVIFLNIYLCSFAPALAKQHRNHEPSAEKEAGALRQKLELTEGRVMDLVSKLESVSVDATRAKSEIQDTLNEAWSLVDLLSKNRCDDAIETIRIKQKDFEVQLEANQEIIHQRDKLIAKANTERDEVEIARLEVKKLVPILESEKEALKREVLELRNKLAAIGAVQNGSNIHFSLNPYFHAMAEKLGERAKISAQILTAANKINNGNDETLRGLSSLDHLVRDVDSQFHNTLVALRSGNLDPVSLKQSGDDSVLERQLRETQVAKDAAMKEVKKLYEALHALQQSQSHSTLGSPQHSESIWVIIISILIGSAITALLTSLRNRKGGGVGPAAGLSGVQGPQQGFGPTSMRFGAVHTSEAAAEATPVQIDWGMKDAAVSLMKSAQTPTPRASPAIGFAAAGVARSNPSPMQYATNRENTPSSFRRMNKQG